jgi:hypothetical protein
MTQPKLLECMGVLKVIYDMFFGRLAFLVKQQQESCRQTDVGHSGCLEAPVKTESEGST